jgi:K+-sensing histidine kinase KdpD
VNERAKPPISSRQARWKAYLLPLAITAAVAALRVGLASWFGDRPVLILFVLPIFLGAYVGGLGPGLVTAAVAALGTSYLLIQPLGSLAIASSVDTWDWLMMIVAGVLISTLTDARLQEIQRQEATARRRGDFLPSEKCRSGLPWPSPVWAWSGSCPSPA